MPKICAQFLRVLFLVYILRSVRSAPVDNWWTPTSDSNEREHLVQWADDALPSAVATANPALANYHWGYKQQTDELPPDLWKELYPQCSGARQSPIEIDLLPLVLDLTLESLDISDYTAQPLNNAWTLVDNGHSVQFSAKYQNTPTITKGSLGADYVLTQFHFHWGATDDRGSEHVINGTRYPLELHLVHRKVADTDAQSLGDSTGLAVIGVLFEIAQSNEPANLHLAALTDAVRQATTLNVPVTVTLPDVRLTDILPPSPAYYRYLGSLTTPPCAEVVIWTVMRKPVKITEAQMQIFRSLREEPLDITSKTPTAGDGRDSRLVDNYRPLQQSAGRVVRYHPETYTVFVP